MLEVLKIKNIAVIDEAEIPFEGGLNVLSGETGAGKSVVIEAIGLLLGSRASADLIRKGADEAQAEGLFDITGLDWMKERLARLGFDSNVSELLVKRTIHSSGRSKVSVNGELATLGMLADLCEGLVDLCGQHEHQSVLKSHKQLELLDRFGGLDGRAEEVKALFQTARALRKELESLKSTEEERARKADFLKFQIEELKAADLHSGEDEKLQEEKKLLQSVESRLKVVHQVVDLVGEEGGLLDMIRSAAVSLRQLREMDPKTESISEGLTRVAAEAEEVDRELRRYLVQMDADPSRLEQIMERLARIAELRRKYGASVEEMILVLGRLEGELAGIEGASGRIDQLGEEVLQAEKNLLSKGLELSKARAKVAKLLSDSVTGELQDLKMAGAELKISIERSEDLNEWTAAGGADKIQYLIRTNKGDDVKPLGRIASGGELSRVMLAIRRVISDRGGIGVYLFDEIDAGIGGQTAFQVGKKLKSVAKHNQVICITHLPQVASFADHHLIVEKSSRGDRTLTDVRALSAKERREEIARMLGGKSLTPASLKNASELLEMARS